MLLFARVSNVSHASSLGSVCLDSSAGFAGFAAIAGFAAATGFVGLVGSAGFAKAKKVMYQLR